MIYEQYRAKIKKWAKVWATIKRFRVLILSVLIFVTATVTGLLVARGTVYGATDMPSTITYGESFAYKAKGFMSKVSYEYSPVATDEWTKETPNVPGTYRVRAVTKTAFGGKRYGKSQQFTLQPKPVALSVSQSELVYGNTPTLTGDLFNGDRAVCNEYAYTGLGTDTVTVQAQPQHVRIYNQDNRDVTACYTVQTVEKNVTMTARSITISVTDATHVYDGMEFSSEEYTLADGSLAFSDEISALFTARVTDYTPQPVENTATFSISNADGVNVTKYYDITALSGTLTVEKRALFIQTQSQSQEYDGTPLSAASFEFTSDGLVDGHTLAIKDGTANSIIKTGSVRNAFTPVITDGADNDATDNYAFSFPEDSLLTITPRNLTVISEDREKVYDGTPLSWHEFTYDGLIGDDTIKATFSGSITVVGSARNVFTVNKIENALGDVTDCYTIDEQYGTLKVTPRKIKVITSTLEKVYDGKPLQEMGVNGDFSALVQEADEANGYYGLVTGHKLIAPYARASITDVQWIEGENGKEVNTVKNEIDFRVENEEISKNYDIICTCGTLKITPRPITVKSPNGNKVYDGTPLTCREENVLSGESPYGYADGQEGVASEWGSQTEANADFGVNKQDRENNTFTLRIKIKGTEAYTTENYKITYHYGSLNVQRLPITIMAKSDEVVYNGKQQEIEAGSIKTPDKLLIELGHKIFGVETQGASGINAGEYPHEIVRSTENIRIYKNNEQGEDVTRNYQISFEDGKLTITQRAVYIVTNDVCWLYDGLEHYDGDGIEYVHNGVTYKNDGVYTEKNFRTGVIDGVKYYPLADGHELCGYLYPTMTNVLWMDDEIASRENAVSFQILKGTEPMDDNYVFKFENGKMTIIPRKITVFSESAHKVYDGDFLMRAGFNLAENSPCNFVDGQQGIAHSWGIQKKANAEFGEIKYDLENNKFKIIVQIMATREDVTSNYDITYEYGSLTVQKRPIFVTTRDCTWVYDGKPHSDGDGENYSGIYTNDELTYDNITYYPLVDGHNLYIDTVTHVRFWIDTKDGGKKNELTFKVENDEINENYTIKIEYGKLTIEKRPIYIQSTHSIEWIYDGEAHYDGDGQSALYGNDDLWKGGIEGYTILALNDSLVITTPIDERAHATYVWESGKANVLTFTVEDGQGDYTGDNYADNYDIRQPDPYTYGTLTILPRPIYVTGTHDCTWTYDGETHYDGDGTTKDYTDDDLSNEGYKLVEGDRLVIATPIYERPCVTYVWESGKANALTFTVQAGRYQGNENYADNYDIRQPEDYGTLTIKPRPITIQTHTLSWVYNGLEHYDETLYSNADVIKGSMVKEDYISLITLDEQKVRVKNVADRNADNVLAFTVIGNYVGEYNYADNYEISYEYGKLNIKLRPIWISTESVQVVYDGREHALSVYDCEKGTTATERGLLVDLDHTLSITFIKYIDAGVYDTVELLVQEVLLADENGVNVERNYKIDWSRLGSLVINRRQIVVTTGSANKIYDGTPLVNNESDYQREGEGVGLLESLGHTIEIRVTGKATNVWESGKNTCEVTIFDGNGRKVYADVYTDGEAVKFNYEVVKEEGLLTVTPREIIVQTGSAEKVYDGLPLKNANYALNAEDQAFLDSLGHILSLETNGEQTEVGESKNTIGFVDIADGSGEPMRYNYEIREVHGTLRVTERPSTEIGGAGDQDVIVATVYTEKDGRVYLRSESYGDYTGTGWKAAKEYGDTLDGTYGMQYLTGIALQNAELGEFDEMRVKIVEPSVGYLLPYYLRNKPNAYTIQSGDALNVGATQTDYYVNYILYDYLSDGKVESGNLDAYSTAEAAYRNYVYENYLALPASTTQYLLSIIPEAWNASDTDIIGKVARFIQESATYNLEAQWKTQSDVVVEFLRDHKEGICQHYASAATAMFRALGIPARYTVGATVEAVAQETVEVKGSNMHAWVEVYIDGVGWIEVEVTGAGPAMGGNQPSGEFTIKPEDQIVSAFEADFVEAQNVIVDVDGKTDFSDYLAQGYTYQAVVNGRQEGVGASESTILSFRFIDPHGEDVTDKFIIHQEKGLLKVVAGYTLSIGLSELQKYYDGTPLAYTESDPWWIEEDNLPENWTVELNLVGLSLTEVGRVLDDKIHERLKIYDDTNTLVYEFIDGEAQVYCEEDVSVSFSQERLSIGKRSITLRARTIEKIFDGNELTGGNTADITFGSLAKGHTMEIVTEGSRTYPGYSENAIVSVIIYDEQGNDVTQNYAIKKLPGRLTVLEDE